MPKSGRDFFTDCVTPQMSGAETKIQMRTAFMMGSGFGGFSDVVFGIDGTHQQIGNEADKQYAADFPPRSKEKSVEPAYLWCVQRLIADVGLDQKQRAEGSCFIALNQGFALVLAKRYPCTKKT